MKTLLIERRCGVALKHGSFSSAVSRMLRSILSGIRLALNDAINSCSVVVLIIGEFLNSRLLYGETIAIDVYVNIADEVIGVITINC